MHIPSSAAFLHYAAVSWFDPPFAFPAEDELFISCSP